MHYHWAKLYLNSYVLRGLPEGAPIPEHFLETAAAAVAAAISIITLLLEDRDAQTALAYVPHHVHGMMAFACMFLLKVATKYSEQLFIDKGRFQLLMGALARQFKTTDVGKDHLIHRMAEGLEKMAEMLDGDPKTKSSKNGKATNTELIQQEAPLLTSQPARLMNGESAVPDYGNIDPSAFDYPALGLGMPFFDFEGTTLTPGESMWNFSN